MDRKGQGFIGSVRVDDAKDARKDRGQIVKQIRAVDGGPAAREETCHELAQAWGDVSVRELDPAKLRETWVKKWATSKRLIFTPKRSEQRGAIR